jgi:hypothetical protein
MSRRLSTLSVSFAPHISTMTRFAAAITGSPSSRGP